MAAPYINPRTSALNIYDVLDEGKFILDTCPGPMGREVRLSYKLDTGIIQFPGPLVYYFQGARHELGYNIDQLDGRISNEITLARQEEAKIANAVVVEANRAVAAEAKLSTDLAAESTRAKSAESASLAAVAVEAQTRASAITTLTNSLANAEAAAGAADVVHTNDIATLNAGLTAEIARATSTETSNFNEHLTIANSLSESITVVSVRINDEVKRATAAEGKVAADMAAETLARTQAISAEASARATAISTESARAQTAEAALQEKINLIMSNIDPAAMDSFTEVVAAFQSNGFTVTENLSQYQATTDAALQAAMLRIEALEQMVLFLSHQGPGEPGDAAEEEGEEDFPLEIDVP